MILLIDNYDSFVYNLARYLQLLGQDTRVVRNDAVDCDQIRRWRPQAILISPGPCSPAESGCSLEVVRTFWEEIPIFGVCLGHQAIAAAFGAKIVRSNEPMHGRTSEVRHDGLGVFQNLPNPLRVCRYHSLTVDLATLPSQLEVAATSSDGTIMAIRHRQRPVVGVQFHPESILTEGGFEILAQFLRQGGLDVPESIPTRHNELTHHLV